MKMPSLRTIVAEAAVYLRALLRLVRDPATPRAVRWLAIAVLAYALSPIDLIPDAIPLIGQLDDLLLVPLGVALVVWLTPREHWRACLEAARAAPGEGLPRWRWGAVLVGLAWVVMLGLSLALLWSFTAGRAQAREPRGPAVIEGTVSRVSDGDTLWLRPAVGAAPLKLRLQGIDAPEICQAGGPQARAALRELALNRRVRAEIVARDRYGRSVAAVQLDGRDIAAEMVAAGWAWSDARPGWRGRYDTEEDAARRARIGVHAAGDAQRPSEFRRAQGACPTAAPPGGASHTLSARSPAATRPAPAPRAR